MASTTYLRPNLFPFPFSSIGDYSGNATYAKFGTTTDALNFLTNLLTFQVSVSWNVSWKYVLSPNVYNSSVTTNINLPLFIPSYAGSTNYSQISWYNSDNIGTKRATPAARVLYSGSGGNAVQESNTSNENPGGDDFGLDADLRLNRTGTVIGLALRLYAVESFLFFASFSGDTDEDSTIATTSINLMGTSVPFYLRTQNPPLSQYEFLGPITFNATVTPTFAAT